MNEHQTISASEFKAKCLDILDRVASHKLEQVTITKRGRIVAVLSPPPASVGVGDSDYASMKGRVWMEPGLDLTAPIIPPPNNDDD